MGVGRTASSVDQELLHEFKLMDYRTYSDRLAYILEMIRKGQVSSPDQLAERFDCSERTIRKMINDLRQSGHTIKYSRREMKYVLIK